VAAPVHRTGAFMVFKSGHCPKQKAHPYGWAFVLELLARFELATSSLPSIKDVGRTSGKYSKI